MAINEPVRQDAGITLDDDRLVITKMSFQAPAAVELLRAADENDRTHLFAEIVDVGAQTLTAARTNATLRLMQEELGTTVERTRDALEEVLSDSQETADEKRAKADKAFRKELDEIFTRYFGEDSTQAVHRKLEKVIKQTEERLYKSVFEDGDESAMGRMRKQLSAELKSAVAVLTEQIAVSKMKRTPSVMGTDFEVVLTESLSNIARCYGDTVEHTGKLAGNSGQTGDIVVTLASDATGGALDIRIVVEAKTRAPSGTARFSANAIRDSLSKARTNRGAAAGLFVVEGRDLLPIGGDWQEFGSSNFAMSWVSGESDSALAVTYRMVRDILIADIRAAADSETIDPEAIRSATKDIREGLKRIDVIKAQHTKAINNIGNAGSAAEALWDAVMDSVRRLDDAAGT